MTASTSQGTPAGFSDARRLADRHEQGVLRASDRYRARQVQRIEQGMGRGIRSNEVYCVVVLMGAQLLHTLYASGAARHFSPATASQLTLSAQISEQVAHKGLAALAEPINDMLTRNPGWVAASRNALIEASYPTSVVVDSIAIAQRQAFDVARRGRFEQSKQYLQDAANAAGEDPVKGWLLEQAATICTRLIGRAASRSSLPPVSGSSALNAFSGRRQLRRPRPPVAPRIRSGRSG